MTDEPRCRCAMFQDKGICYHTGYKPTFRGNLVDRVKKAVDSAVAKDKKEREESVNPK